MKIAIIAGEHSGDILGAGLIRALKQHAPELEFIGIAGPRMQQEGMTSFFPMEELAVMGLVEVLGQLPRLLKRKRELVDFLLTEKPDVLVGIDAPDFNLRIEKIVKQAGIKTVHYVSPSVWAWRQKRIFKIAEATHQVLALLPFEKAFYDKHQVPCEFVGHTLADDIPMYLDKQEARRGLGLRQDAQTVALMPGSRGSELKLLAPCFIEAARILQQQNPDVQFIAPMVSQARAEQFDQIQQALAPELNISVHMDAARQVMAAADAIMIASGTATLEAMLVKRPMVVAYKLNPMTYWLAQRLVKVDYFSLPNLIAQKPLVPELLQEQASPQAIAEQVQAYLDSDNQELIQAFEDLHQQIRCNASEQAALAVLSVVNDG